jgi:hypothetical protein
VADSLAFLVRVTLFFNGGEINHFKEYRGWHLALSQCCAAAAPSVPSDNHFAMASSTFDVTLILSLNLS